MYNDRLKELYAQKAEPFFEDISDYDKPVDRHILDAKKAVIAAYNPFDAGAAVTPLTMDQVYVISFTYILGNWKATLSTTVVGDGLFFEVTCNQREQEVYVDIYNKTQNVALPLELLWMQK